MLSKKARVFVNPGNLCALIVLIMSAPKVLTETNCECLVLSKHSGVEWIGDCADTTTEMTSTTYTMATEPDVAEPDKETQKPVISSLPNSLINVTSKPVTLASKPVTLASTPTNLTTKNTTSISTSNISTPNIRTEMSDTKVTKALTTSKTSTNDNLGKPGSTSPATIKTSSEMQVSQPVDQEISRRTEPVSEPTQTDNITLGSTIGTVIGFGVVILAVVLLWKLGVLKKCRKHCNRSKVSITDAENGDISQNGMKTDEKISKSL